MRVKPSILIFISLLLLIGTVAAVGIPDTVELVSNNSWVVANGVDQKIITVRVLNTTLGYEGVISGVLVNFNVADPSYGNMTPLSNLTETNGEAQSTFKVKTKSGIATITAMTSFGNNLTIYQNIDHNSAYFADFTYPMNGTVASEVPFTISLTDRYRNPIDNRRGNHIINLHVHGPFPDDCGFAEAGYGHDSARILDANGNTSVNVKLTSKIGDNNIAMDAYQSIPNQLAWISAEAIGKPFSMTQVYSPSGSPPTLPADGVKYFTILYNLYDEYGNPTNKQFIWVNTSIPGEERQFMSNNIGQVTVQYGPRSSIGEIDITATSVGNSTLTLMQRVKFKNTAAEIISLTANPDTMPSQDANPLFTSNIIATVADISGNAVEGETVNFIIENITYDATYNVTADPNLLTSSAITDVYGRAVVQLRPGSFTTVGNPGYNATATGQCTVNATWKNSTKKLSVTWKNYPYLSVSTSVTPHTVEINKTIDVTIEFRGDGFALQPTPIDVVMVIDKSGSMENYNIGGITRMQAAKNAAHTFVNKMNEGTDRIGIVSFDREDTVIMDAPLGASFSDISNKINAIDPNNGGTAMRQGFKQGIDHLKANGRPSAVRAVILMTDGNWNLGGSPLAVGKGYDINTWVRDNRDRGVSTKYYGFSGLATDFEDQDYRWYSGLGGDLSSSSNTVVKTPRQINPSTGADVAPRTTETRGGGSYYVNGQFTQQNMSIYAKDNNIRLYTLSFATTIPTDERNALIALANSTGGFYRHAPTQAALEAFYTEIAGDLKDTAAVNATMMADFDKINVTGFPMDGDQVYDYVYHPTESTKIRWQNGITNVSDQSADWLADSKLDFNIGTIKVGQYWKATFRLKIKQGGLIDVFGNHSMVSFNGGTEILNLPHTFITVVPNLNVTEITVKTITLDNLMCTETGEIKALFPVKWNTNYTGNKTLTEAVKYCIKGPSSNCVDTGQWVQFDTKTHTYDPLTMEYVDFGQLDVTKLPPGEFKIQVRATASDAPDAVAETGFKPVGGQGKTFIKLEAPPFENFEKILVDTQFFNQNPWGIVHSWSG
jgi:hypothetical protein